MFLRAQAGRTHALPSLLSSSARLRSLAHGMPLRRAAGIAISRNARVMARSPGLDTYLAPSLETPNKEAGSFVGNFCAGLAATSAYRAQLPRPTYARAAIFCLGALVAFVLAAIVRKALIVLTLGSGKVNPSSHDLRLARESALGKRGRGLARYHEMTATHARTSDRGGDWVIESDDTELQDMTEVMQHAAQKVGVMQQVVDATKARLQDEMKLTISLKEEVKSLKEQVSSSEEMQLYGQSFSLHSSAQSIQSEQSIFSTGSAVNDPGMAPDQEHQDGGREQALSRALLSLQSERDELATVLSTSQEQNVTMHAKLSAALEQVLQSERLTLERRERTDAVEAEKAAFAAEVEQLPSQRALAFDQSHQRDESVKLLQQQLMQMKQQMDASNTALQALEAASQEQAAQAQSRLDSLQSQLQHERMEKVSADQAAQQVVHKLAEYERGIIKCVSDILEGKVQSQVGQSTADAEPWWGLPDAQLAEFLQMQEARLEEARSQKQAIWDEMPEIDRREAERLQEDVHQAIQQHMAIGGESSVPSAEQHQAECKLQDYLEENMPSERFMIFEALKSECVELEKRSADLRRALDLSTAERLLQLLAQQTSELQQAAAGQTALRQAVAGPQEQQKLQALAQDLANRQIQLEEQELQLLQRQETLESKAVSAEERDTSIRELAEQTQKKEVNLSAQEQELRRFEETLKKRESRLEHQTRRLDAQIQKEGESEVAARAMGSASDANDAEKNRLKVVALQEELASLKEMYSRQFVSSKQELDAAQGRIQQLRRQMLRPHNGVEPSTDSNSELDSGSTSDSSSGQSGHVPDSEFSLWASELITKVSRSPPDVPTLDTNPSAQNCVAGVSAHQAHSPVRASVSTLERQAVPTTEEEAVPAKVKLHLQAVGCCVPHPNKVERGGEDAHFVLGSFAIGVADGVGGWSKSGVNPGEYSKRLMRYTEQAIRQDATASCVKALEYAHDRVNVPGSCTAIVAKLRSDSSLEIANLGDSGLRIVRDGQIIFATDSLQHGFNMPYQLGNKNLIPYTDVPASSFQSVVTVQPGDVIVMASDGFFDNVWDEDLARLVKNSCLVEDSEQEDCVANMAENLARVAANNSRDTMFRSPWSVECSKQSDSVNFLRKLFPRGGKVDDITVVLARVRDC